jgi:hypothetical protein
MRKKLSEYQEREIEINDPKDVSTKSTVKFHDHHGFWEPEGILREINLLPLGPLAKY